MPDPRIIKLAQVLVRYSLDLKPGELFFIEAHPPAQDLTLAVYKEALLAGAHPIIRVILPGELETYYNYASDAELEFVNPIYRMVNEEFQATLYIEAPSNTRILAGIDPAKMNRAARARDESNQTFFKRAAVGEVKWSYTVFPTDALAQEAGMSLSDYEKFVYTACMLHLPDPVAAWREEAARQQRLINWLAGKDQVIIQGSDVDLQFSIKGRIFDESAGTENFPSGEIFTSPVEHSIDGWVRFSYPAIFRGHEIEGVELWFENGKVVKEQASRGSDLLIATLNTDDGARYIGEWGIGTNYNIQRFTKHMLFDEKIGGTIHFALGNSYPETGGLNKSAIHWDMLVDMADSEVLIDGELFYRNGQFAVNG